jgi:uncharacterized protein
MPLETQVDSFELARSRRRLEGGIAVARLRRLAESLAATDGVLHYRIDGIVDDSGHPGADLHLKGRLRLVCQRCNALLDFDLDRTTRFRFVASEEELNSLPIEDTEVDAVVGSRTMNILDWIEDEAILSLPLVPRHDECSPPLATGSDSSAAATPNPFAVLAALRNGGGGSGPRG